MFLIGLQIYSFNSFLENDFEFFYFKCFVILRRRVYAVLCLSGFYGGSGLAFFCCEQLILYTGKNIGHLRQKYPIFCVKIKPVFSQNVGHFFLC